MRFITPMWHPNSFVFSTLDPTFQLTRRSWIVYPDGAVCISILVGCSLIDFDVSFTLLQHPPGDDQYGYEDSGERWLPVHTVESIVGWIPHDSPSELTFDSVIERHLSLIFRAPRHR